MPNDEEACSQERQTPDEMTARTVLLSNTSSISPSVLNFKLYFPWVHSFSRSQYALWRGWLRLCVCRSVCVAVYASVSLEKSKGLCTRLCVCVCVWERKKFKLVWHLTERWDLPSCLLQRPPSVLPRTESLCGFIPFGFVQFSFSICIFSIK